MPKKEQSTKQALSAFDLMSPYDQADIIESPGLPGVNLAADEPGKSAFVDAVKEKAGVSGAYTKEKGGMIHNSHSITEDTLPMRPRRPLPK